MEQETDTVTFDLILNQLQNELVSLRKNLDFEVDDLSKKELKRTVNRLRTLLIATLESPIEATQEMDENLKSTLFQKTMGIRHLQTALSMFAVSDDELGNIEKDLIAKAKKEAENKNESPESDVEMEKDNG